MQSKAKTISEYLESLPPDRKKIVTDIRKKIKSNLPKGFKEEMSYGMIGFVVPHSVYPKGYHATPQLPLPFINLASQKNYISLYHMGLMEGPLLDWFRAEWKKSTTSRLDMGKCCIRFKKPEDVPLELIGELVTKMTPAQWIEKYEASVSTQEKKRKKA
jgi:uncharacterized protein YdhG (YjbR/CyaY superfamily)